MQTTVVDLIYHTICNESELDKTVGWPSERMDVCELMFEIKKNKTWKDKNNFLDQHTRG